MKKLLHTTLLVAGLSWSALAFSLELDAAKASGLVGEQPSGYLGVVGTATPAVTALVNDINAKRKAAYAEIAQRNGTALDAVEQLAGKKAIEKTPPGQYVKLPSGEWLQVK
ncbi:MAG: YdbL family protein [Spongiibacteraceae bacterium]